MDNVTPLIEVWDENQQLPIVNVPDLISESGRGLFLVAHLAKQWGYYLPPEGGKVVWCELVTVGGAL